MCTSVSVTCVVFGVESSYNKVKYGVASSYNKVEYGSIDSVIQMHLENLIIYYSQTMAPFFFLAPLK